MKPQRFQPAKAAVAAAISVLSLFAFQCVEMPQDPVAPNWDTQLSVPLVDSTYHLSEAMTSNTGIVIENGGYVYRPERFQYDPVPFGKDLQLFPPFGAQLINQTVGNVTVPLPSPVRVDVAASAVLGGSVPSGSAVFPPIPAQSFPKGAIPPLLAGLDNIHFVTGTMGLAIHNALPIPIEFPSGFSLVNTNGGDVVASFPAATINPHETWTPSASLLNGRTMKNQMEFSAQFQSAGSGSDAVTFDPDSGVSVSYTFDGFTVDEATGTFFQPFEHTANSAPYIVDSLTLIQQVSFNSGKLRLSIQSTLNAASTVNVTMSQLRSAATDNPFSFDVRLDGNTTFDSTLDMREWKIKSPDGSLVNSFDLAVTIKNDPLSSGTPVTVRSTDFIRASLLATEAPFAIHQLQGVTRTLHLDIDQDVDVPLGTFSSAFSADSILADSISINLHVGQPAHPVDLNLALIGRDANGSVVASMPAFTQRVAAGADASYGFPAGQMAQFLSGFISRHGTHVSVVGGATINPDDVYHTIPHQIANLQDTSQLYLGLEVVFPIRAGLINGKIVDTVAVGANSAGGPTVDKDLLTSVKQAGVFFVVDNAIPVGVSLKLDFLDQFGNTILTLPKPGQPAILVEAGTYAAPTHTASPIGLSINTDDAKKFGDAVNVIVNVGLNSGGVVGVFTPNDYVHVRAYSNMVFNVNPDKLKNQ